MHMPAKPRQKEKMTVPMQLSIARTVIMSYYSGSLVPRANPVIKGIIMKVRLLPALFAVAIFLIMPPSSYSDSRSDKKPVQYRLRQILLEPEPSPQHDGEVLTRAVDCLNKARSGEDFTMLARRYSQEPGAGRTGGDLGFFTRGQMVKPFSEVVFSMKPGEIRGPVKTRFGYHIIKLLEIRGKKRHAQHILFALIPNHADSIFTLNMLRNIRRQAENGTSFDELCSRYNTLEELKKSDGYMVWQRPEEMLEEFQKIVSGMKTGEISQPFISILGFHLVLVDSINCNPACILQGFPDKVEKKMKEIK